MFTKRRARTAGHPMIDHTAEAKARSRACRPRRVALALTLGLPALVLVGCTSSGPKSAPSTMPSSVGVSQSTEVTTSLPPLASSSKATPTTTAPTESPAQPAITAYRQYLKATYNAQRSPRKVGGKYASDADFTKFAFDPMLTQENAYIESLSQQGEAFRGTPPSPRISIKQTNLTAKPYPTVVLTNCPESASAWVAYEVATGEPVPFTSPKVKPPYLSTVTLIYYKDHWGIQSTSVDSSRTCSG